MAARRPPSRAASTTTAPALPRSRSVLARPTADSQPQSSKHIPKQPSESDAETNIQVVIRCRRRSEREIQDRSPIIVSTEGPRSRQLAIEAANPASSLGVISLAPVRTYPFDLVFGPEADQAMIYHDVVSPMLEQVLMGYNCTLFAYGQTGTGKTYTMQGDLELTPIGNPSQNAGMIPRVVFRLFHQLETSGADFSVKISYIELYNEELRDLLAPETAQSSSNSQTGAKDLSQQGIPALKIFDDASKRGVFIQGLEEIAVKDSTMALALLIKGSERRQTAATKFNDHSSRSHSVFSITVHTKETSGMGDDLLKIGKLNLVDLAGSENIGRSGAENKRAREAGMINQSLLTLGRVINALVDKSPHVPYRESKLTRLLQDSLGGRTKTCIIATISPARSNMEETLSTLDYAMHAKSIRNKPELNQRMTRNSLLKEYIGEIERLKSDLLAAREKNGIFFSEENWKQINAEQELRQTELDESKKQVEIVGSQLRAVREEFEQTIGILMKKEKRLEELNGELKKTEDALSVNRVELTDVKSALEEEIVVRKAYQDNEATLDTVATSLKKVTQESLRDVDSLFGKLERKTSTLQSSNKAVIGNSKAISRDTSAIHRRLEEFSKTSTHSTKSLIDNVSSFQTKEMEMLSTYSARIDDQLKRMQEALNSVRSRESAENEAINTIKDTSKATQDNLKVEFSKWGKELAKTYEETGDAARDSGADGFEALEGSLNDVGSLVEGMIKEVKTWAEGSLETIVKMRKDSENATQEEIIRLKKQNDMLLRLVANEKAKAEKGKDELLQRVSGLLGDFVRDRDEGLKHAVASLQTGNDDGAKRMKTLQARYVDAADGLSQQSNKLLEVVQEKSIQTKRTWDGALKTSEKYKSDFDGKITQMQSAISASVTSYTGRLQKQTEAMATRTSESLVQHDRAKRQRIDALDAMVVDVQSEYRSLQRGLASTSRNIETLSTRIQSDTSAMTTTTGNFTKATSTSLANIQQGLQSIVEGVSKEDIPTGMTPKKRVWQYVDQWELTGKRDNLLRSWRERGNRTIPAGPSQETVLAVHTALPEDDRFSDDGEVTTDKDGDEDSDLTADETERQIAPPSEVKAEDDDTITLAYTPASSTSSSSSNIPPMQTRGRTRKNSALVQPQQKVVFPAQPLTDSRVSNVVRRRGSKRARG